MQSSAQKLNSDKNEKKKSKSQSIDIIKETKRIVAGKSVYERFTIARMHLFNALDYKTPRLDMLEKDTSPTIKIIYEFQTWYVWRGFLLLLAYLFMYAAFFGHVHPNYIQIGIEFGFLFFMFLDVVFEIIQKMYNRLRPRSRFQPRFYVRVMTLILLLADEIIVVST